MKLSEKFNLQTLVVLVGLPELTTKKSSTGEFYYRCQLLNPVIVSCSVEKKILAHEVDEVYIRESAVRQDGWEFVDEKDPSKGYYMPKWVVDFSKNQMIPLYQETTILEWRRGNNIVTGEERVASANDAIRADMEARKKKLQAQTLSE